MVKFLIASNDEDEINQYKYIFKNEYNIDLLSPKDIGLEFECKEKSTLYRSNALMKICELEKMLECFSEYKESIIIGTCSGIEIEFLKDGPGVHSKTYLGEDKTYKDRMKYILHKMEKAYGKERKAKYVTYIFMHDNRSIRKYKSNDNARYGCSNEYMDFMVNEKIENGNEFSSKYDPIIYIEDKRTTFSNLDIKDKVKLSKKSNILREIMIYSCPELVQYLFDKNTEGVLYSAT